MAGHYTGVNALGVKAQVEKRHVVQRELAFDWSNDPDATGLFSRSLPLAAEKAAAVKPLLRYLLVAKLVPLRGAGMAESSVEHRAPRLDDLYDLVIHHECLFADRVALWVYNVQTGEVLRRFKIAGDDMPAPQWDRK